MSKALPRASKDWESNPKGSLFLWNAYSAGIICSAAVSDATPHTAWSLLEVVCGWILATVDQGHVSVPCKGSEGFRKRMEHGQ